jgi:hypothetical protein
MVAFDDLVPKKQQPLSFNDLVPEQGSVQAAGQQFRPESQSRTALEQGLQGATFGFADEITDRIGAGIASAVTGEPYSELLQRARQNTLGREKRQFEQHPGTAITSNIGGALLTGGAGATTKGGQLLSKALTTGGTGAKIAKGAGLGAATGGLYGAGQSQEGERLTGAKEGAGLGAAFGGAVPAVGGVLKSAVMPKISEAIKPLAERAKSFDIPLRMDQISPTRFRKTVQKVSQEIPLSGEDAFEDIQRQSFNKAIAKTIGQKADDLSPKTIKNFRRDAEKKFGNTLIGTKIKVDDDDLNNVLKIYDEATENLGGNLLPVVRKNVDKALEDLGTESLSGVKLTSLRSNLLKNSTRAEGAAKVYIGDLVEAIDDIAAKNLPKDKMNQLKEARKEWRNYRTIEPLLEKSVDGTIEPTQLANRVATSKYIKASTSSVGEDDLVDLGRIGKEFLRKAGGSDTFQKVALGAGTVGGIIDPVTGAILGGTVAGNRALQAANRSQALVNRALKQKGATKASLLPSMLAGELGASGNKNR